jgi:hypothetical protein
VKKSITVVQLVQFGLFFAHALFGCVVATHYRPRIIIALCLFQAVAFASLFANFFWCAAQTLAGCAQGNTMHTIILLCIASLWRIHKRL